MRFKFDGLGRIIGAGLLGCMALVPLAADAQMDFMNKLNQLKGQVEKELGAAGKAESERPSVEGQVHSKLPAEAQAGSAGNLSEFDIKGIRLGMTKNQITEILKNEPKHRCEIVANYFLCGSARSVGGRGAFSFFGDIRQAQFELGWEFDKPTKLIKGWVEVGASERSSLLNALTDKLGRAPIGGSRTVNGKQVATSIWKDKEGNMLELDQDGYLQMKTADYDQIMNAASEKAKRYKEEAVKKEAAQKKSDI